MSESPLRVGFLTICPSPYIQDLFSAIHADGRIQPRVFYQEWLSPAFSWEVSEQPEYATVLESRIIRFMGARLFWNSSAVRTISNHDYDLFVVAGYASITSQLVIRWLNRSGIPWVFWGEVPGFQNRGWLGRFLRERAIAPVIKRTQGVAAVGHRAQEAYQRLMPGRPVASIPYYSDVSAFSDSIRERDPEDTTVELLFCGQIVPRKGVHELTAAVLRLIPEHDIRLRFLGDGESQSELQELIPEDFQDRFLFEGFRQTDELPRFFRNADVFVLPSRHDGWGVVINQALAAELPIVSTEAVGAAIDLVEDGVNGRLVPPGDEVALTAALRDVVSDAEARKRMGCESGRAAASWTPTVEVERWLELFEQVISNAGGQSR